MGSAEAREETKREQGEETEQGRKQKTQQKTPPHSPQSPFFSSPIPPHSPPSSIPAKAGISLSSASGANSPPKAAKTGDSRFRGNGEFFFSLPIPLILLFSFPPFFYYPRLPPTPPIPPHSHSRESGNLPTPAPAARIPRQRRAKTKSPPKAGNPPKSPYPLRAEKKYPPRPLIVPPRPRLTKKQHQSAFFCILLRFGRQKMVFYRVMGVPPASEAHLFRHWRNK